MGPGRYFFFGFPDVKCAEFSENSEWGSGAQGGICLLYVGPNKCDMCGMLEEFCMFHGRNPQEFQQNTKLSHLQVWNVRNSLRILHISRGRQQV